MNPRGGVEETTPNVREDLKNATIAADKLIWGVSKLDCLGRRCVDRCGVY
jgi:hypothetical protein